MTVPGALWLIDRGDMGEIVSLRIEMRYYVCQIISEIVIAGIEQIGVVAAVGASLPVIGPEDCC